MEAYAKVVVLAVILGLAIGSEPMGASSQSLCGIPVDGLRACQPAVSTDNPSPPSPTEACCSALGKPQVNLQCFCVFKNSDVLKNYKIDFNKAMELPAKCKINKTVRC
ncbi:Lipid transfer protein [Melia azedarach]|uniref:Lipid transfer protein n=1 Tax=Melia azedarach TaxID=155640 RepID=A0ACC1XZA7_MELAZ|nr:Lipid transfer protein [Melia azedarach]